MAEQENTKPQREGFGERGRGRGGRPGGRPRRPQEDEWTPVTSLGRLVKKGHITTFEEIFYHSIPIKEAEIVDIILKNQSIELKEEVMKVKSVQKQTKAGQRTRFKVVMAVGDSNGHIGIGTKLAKEVQLAMKGALLSAKMNIVPVRRGYWGSNIGEPHTVPMKVTGHCGSVSVRLIPAPRGTGIVGAPVTKKLMGFAGVRDCFSCSSGCSRTTENFVRAIYDALYKTYSFLAPEFWKKRKIVENVYNKFANDLKK